MTDKETTDWVSGKMNKSTFLSRIGIVRYVSAGEERPFWYGRGWWCVRSPDYSTCFIIPLNVIMRAGAALWWFLVMGWPKRLWWENAYMKGYDRGRAYWQTENAELRKQLETIRERITP